MTYDRLPNLKSAMTPFPHSVEADASLKEAEHLIAEHKFNHLPVTDNHEIVGIITTRELASVASAKKGQDPLRVRDVCISDVYIVDLDEPIENVLLMMAERHIGSAIVTRQGRLSGIFTWIDACRSFGEYLRSRNPPSNGDAA